MLIINNTNKSNFTISIKQNTNKILSSTEDNFLGINAGNYIKIGNSEILYPISNVNQIFISKKFTIFSSKEICLNEDSGIDIQNNDLLSIIYDEFEIENINEIINTGQEYRIGDELVLIGGESSVNIENGIPNTTKLIVTETFENGRIKQLSIKDYGKYIIPPGSNCEFISVNGNGNGLVLNLSYKICSSKNVLKRYVKFIRKDIENNKTYLILDYSLPNNLKNGNLSLSKYEILLSNLYLEETKFNVNYELIKNFTPNCKFPLLLKNSISYDVIFNKAMILIDEEINKLKNEILNIKT